MNVCDIFVHEFLSVCSVGLSGFSLALTSFFLRFGAVLCAISGFSGKISLRKGSCRTGFQCLCMIRLNLCILSLFFYLFQVRNSLKCDTCIYYCLNS